MFATDLSENQIRHANIKPHITYQVCPAEKTPFPNQSFDLVTVAQALHWFDFDRFYPELHRVLKPEGIFAAWSYGLASVNPTIDPIINYFYEEILGPYWDKRRSLIDDKYQTIPFPLKKHATPSFKIHAEWTLEQYVNYIAKTWSSVQTYVQQHGSNPVDLIIVNLKATWGPTNRRIITWPIYLLLGSFA